MVASIDAREIVVRVVVDEFVAEKGNCDAALNGKHAPAAVTALVIVYQSVFRALVDCHGVACAFIVEGT
jgi:hypothetical protein